MAHEELGAAKSDLLCWRKWTLSILYSPSICLVNVVPLEWWQGGWGGNGLGLRRHTRRQPTLTA